VKSNSGFTHIELLITVKIVALLASIAMPLAEVAATRGKEQDLRRSLREIRNAIDAYKKASDDGVIERPADDLMAYQHSRPSSFFTAKGIDKLTGTKVMAERLGFDLDQSVGAGDTAMDTFLNGVGLSVHVGRKLEFRGTRSTVQVANSLELGDLLFAVANWSRHFRVDPEEALRLANAKFERRFRAMEQLARERSLALESLDAAAWDALWNEVKQQEKSGEISVQ
jgi:type II secretory pathway pseudopilin PulG